MIFYYINPTFGLFNFITKQQNIGDSKLDNLVCNQNFAYSVCMRPQLTHKYTHLLFTLLTTLIHIQIFHENLSWRSFQNLVGIIFF
jgi:hypothetical protein